LVKGDKRGILNRGKKKKEGLALLFSSPSTPKAPTERYEPRD
jgi:hypothetical protein